MWKLAELLDYPYKLDKQTHTNVLGASLSEISINLFKGHFFLNTVTVHTLGYDYFGKIYLSGDCFQPINQIDIKSVLCTNITIESTIKPRSKSWFRFNIYMKLRSYNYLDGTYSTHEILTPSFPDIPSPLPNQNN